MSSVHWSDMEYIVSPQGLWGLLGHIAHGLNHNLYGPAQYGLIIAGIPARAQVFMHVGGSVSPGSTVYGARRLCGILWDIQPAGSSTICMDLHSTGSLLLVYSLGLRFTCMVGAL